MGFIPFLYVTKAILENASLLTWPNKRMQIKGFKSLGSRTPVKLPELSRQCISVEPPNI